MSTTLRTKILFFAEAVTLAHVTRALVLAQSLDPNFYDIHFACDPRYADLLKNENLTSRLTYWPIFSISQKDFLQATETGKRLFSKQILLRYVQDEIEIIKQVTPDFIINDFRLSAAISAPYSGVKFATVTNAYWSPYCSNTTWPVPSYKAPPLIGKKLFSLLFKTLKPLFLSYHLKPINDLRKLYGLDPFTDFPTGFTFGDYVLYADLPTLNRTIPLPDNHQYLGPVVWSPKISLPEWFSQLNSDQTIVYVSLGSSGDINILEKIAEILAEFNVTAIISTAGRNHQIGKSPNLKIVDFIPGDLVAAKSAFVICNGGSPSVYQALTCGTPILGIPFNLDQFLSMRSVVEEKLGIALGVPEVNETSLRTAINEMLTTGVYQQNSRRIAQEISLYDYRERFTKFLSVILNQQEEHLPQVVSGNV